MGDGNADLLGPPRSRSTDAKPRGALSARVPAEAVPARDARKRVAQGQDTSAQPRRQSARARIAAGQLAAPRVFGYLRHSSRRGGAGRQAGGVPGAQPVAPPPRARLRLADPQHPRRAARHLPGPRDRAHPAAAAAGRAARAGGIARRQLGEPRARRLADAARGGRGCGAGPGGSGRRLLRRPSRRARVDAAVDLSRELRLTAALRSSSSAAPASWRPRAQTDANGLRN